MQYFAKSKFEEEFCWFYLIRGIAWSGLRIHLDMS